jgi:hypothetical protein
MHLGARGFVRRLIDGRRGRAGRQRRPAIVLKRTSASGGALRFRTRDHVRFGRARAGAAARGRACVRQADGRHADRPWSTSSLGDSRVVSAFAPAVSGIVVKPERETAAAASASRERRARRATADDALAEAIRQRLRGAPSSRLASSSWRGEPGRSE